MEAEKNPEKRFWCVVPLDSGKVRWIGLFLVHRAITPWVMPCAGVGSPYRRRDRYEA
jgi:hypothetical protein